MKTKRFIPFIIPAIFSCLLLAGAPTFLFLSSDYSQDAAAKLALSIRQGIPFAVFAVTLIWIGAGVDFGLSQLKSRALRIFASLLTYLVPSLICSLLAAFILLFMGSLVFPPQWKKLPDPPAAAEAVVGAGENSVYIQANLGKYYFCPIDTPSDCWQSTPLTPRRITQSDKVRVREIHDAPSVEPPKNIVSMIGVNLDYGTPILIHYAVLEDGSVWYLKQTVVKKRDADFGAGLFLTLIILPGALILIGVCAGAGLGAISRWLAGRLP